MNQVLDIFEAACTVCHKYSKTSEMHLCDSCNEPVHEDCSSGILLDLGEQGTICSDCIALSKLAEKPES